MAEVNLVDNEEEKECRLLIVGYSGSGKSSLGNKLIGKTSARVEAPNGEGNLREGDQPRAGFLVSSSFGSATRKSQYQTGRLHRPRHIVSLKVVDTPGLFDPEESDLRKTKVEILRGLWLCSPGGPHAIIVVVPFGRFTDLEEQAFDQILQLLDEDKVKDHLIVAFTHGEDLGPLTIREEVANSQIRGLRKIREMVRTRYVIFTNVKEHWDLEVEELMEKVAQVSDDFTRQYVNDALQVHAIEGDIELLKREMNLSREDAVLEVGRRRFGEGEKQSSLIDVLLSVGVLAAVTLGALWLLKM